MSPAASLMCGIVIGGPVSHEQLRGLPGRTIVADRYTRRKPIKFDRHLALPGIDEPLDSIGSLLLRMDQDISTPTLAHLRTPGGLDLSLELFDLDGMFTLDLAPTMPVEKRNSYTVVLPVSRIHLWNPFSGFERISH